MSLGVLDRLRGGDRAFVPAFWLVEVLKVLLLGETKGRIAPDQAASFFDSLRALNPRMDHASLEQVVGSVQIICRDHRLTPYDALYVELAPPSGLPLATLDQPQRNASKALAVRCLRMRQSSLCTPARRQLLRHRSVRRATPPRDASSNSLQPKSQSEHTGRIRARPGRSCAAAKGRITCPVPP